MILPLDAFRPRKPTADDLEALVRIHCDPRTNRFRPGGAPGQEEASGYLAVWLAHWRAHGFGYWTIEDLDTGSVAGFGGVIRKVHRGEDTFNLYFRLDPSCWGRGIAGWIGRSALAEAFDRQGGRSVLGKVRSANVASRRALERLGMVITGHEEDGPGVDSSVLYEITRDMHVAGQGSRP